MIEYDGPRRLPVGSQFSEFSEKPLEAEWFSWDAVDYEEPIPPSPKKIDLRSWATRLPRFGPAFRVLRITLLLALFALTGILLGCMVIVLLCSESLP